MNELHRDPTKRHDFVYLFDVNDGNPNGDPDAGNLPRVDPETMHGIVTDVCIKRKIRDYVSGILGRPIFIQSETALNTLYYRGLSATKNEKGEPVGAPLVVKLTDDSDLKKYLENETVTDWLEEPDVEGLEYDSDSGVLTYLGEARTQRAFMDLLVGDGEVDENLKSALSALARGLAKTAKSAPKLSRDARVLTKETLRKQYFDILMFGAVLTAGTNAGQVRGPVQLTFARSIDPVQPRDLSITRVAITKPSDMLRKQTEMGRKAIVPYGLYRMHGFFNPFLAREGAKGGAYVSEADLRDLWEAMTKMLEFDRSAARGEMTVRGLYVFTHENEKGDAPAHRLFDLVKIKPFGVEPPARSFGDYAGGIRVPEPGALKEFKGVTLTHVVHESAAVGAASSPGS